jgi:hypothetical protein
VAYFRAGSGDDLEGSIMFPKTLCDGFCCGGVPRPLGAQASLGECNDRESFYWLIDSEKGVQRVNQYCNHAHGNKLDGNRNTVQKRRSVPEKFVHLDRKEGLENRADAAVRQTFTGGSRTIYSRLRPNRFDAQRLDTYRRPSILGRQYNAAQKGPRTTNWGRMPLSSFMQSAVASLRLCCPADLQ